VPDWASIQSFQTFPTVQRFKGAQCFSVSKGRSVSAFQRGAAFQGAPRTPDTRSCIVGSRTPEALCKMARRSRLFPPPVRRDARIGASATRGSPPVFNLGRGPIPSCRTLNKRRPTENDSSRSPFRCTSARAAGGRTHRPCPPPTRSSISGYTTRAASTRGAKPTTRPACRYRWVRIRAPRRPARCCPWRK